MHREHLMTAFRQERSSGPLVGWVRVWTLGGQRQCPMPYIRHNCGRLPGLHLDDWPYFGPVPYSSLVWTLVGGSISIFNNRPRSISSALKVVLGLVAIAVPRPLSHGWPGF